jgi:hypothetical protein
VHMSLYLSGPLLFPVALISLCQKPVTLVILYPTYSACGDLSDPCGNATACLAEISSVDDAALCAMKTGFTV